MKLWDADGDQCPATFGGSKRPYAFSHDSKWFAIASCEGDTSGTHILEYSERKDGQISRSWLEIYPDYIRSIFSSGDSKYLITSSLDGFVKIWDPSTGQCTKDLDGNWEAVAASHNTRLLALVSPDDNGNIWHFDEPFQHIQKFPIDVTLRFHPIMTFSVDSRLTAYSDKNSLEIRDIGNGQHQQIRVKDDDENDDKNDNANGLSLDYISRIIFSSDLTMIATHSKAFDCIEVWDVTIGQCPHPGTRCQSLKDTA